MLSSFCARADTPPERVTFPSADGRTTLTGYLFVPPQPVAERVPVVVMMHGRAGAYSTIAMMPLPCRGGIWRGANCGQRTGHDHADRAGRRALHRGSAVADA